MAKKNLDYWEEYQRKKHIAAKKKNMGEFKYNFLLQVNGLLNMELKDYIKEAGGKLNLRLHIEGDTRIYIYDKDFSYINEYNEIKFKDDYFFADKGIPIQEKSLIGHYSYSHLLWLILNFKEEKKYMLKKIDEYIEWKENYLYEKNQK